MDEETAVARTHEGVPGVAQGQRGLDEGQTFLNLLLKQGDK